MTNGSKTTDEVDFLEQSQREGGVTKFHPHAGCNIGFDITHQAATRKTSFANGIVFSEKPLAAGEIFLVEIEETETGWSGHLRIGLTQLNPNTGFELPNYALPDLIHMGPSWVYALMKRNGFPDDDDEYEDIGATPLLPTVEPTLLEDEQEWLRLQQERQRERIEESDDEASARMGELVIQGNSQEENTATLRLDSEEVSDSSSSLLSLSSQEQNAEENQFNADHQRKKSNHVLRREGEMIWTPCGFIHHGALVPRMSGKSKELLPTDVGSRIGVMFVPTSSTKANMHFIINGEDQGPTCRNIPFKNAPIYAVVDVYGSTKSVRTCQVYGVHTLMSRCREVILHSIRLNGVKNLPLPNLLKNYLLFH